MYFSLLCLLFIFIQSFFFIVILWKHIRYSSPSINHTKPPISIVIAAKNEEKHLPKLIKNLLTQNYPTFEIIIVNDQSTDSTEEILENTHSHLFNHISIKEPHPDIASKKQAISSGIKKAKYDWILLTDADCLPASPEWINGMANHIKPTTEIVLGVSPNIYQKNFLSNYIQFEGFYTFLQYSTASMCNIPYMGVGRNLMYKKSLFTKNGFAPHEKIISGDDDLFVNHHATSTNTEICLESEAQTITYPKSTIKTYLTQKKRHISVGKYYSKKSKVITGLFFLSFGISYLAFFISIFQLNKSLLIASLFLFLLKQICFSLIKRKRTFGEKNHFSILSDFIYFLYLSYGFAINLRKTKVEWK